jgi:hypothetical protein
MWTEDNRQRGSSLCSGWWLAVESRAELDQESSAVVNGMEQNNFYDQVFSTSVNRKNTFLQVAVSWCVI